jgi:hypothetical protein
MLDRRVSREARLLYVIVETRRLQPTPHHRITARMIPRSRWSAPVMAQPSWPGSRPVLSGFQRETGTSGSGVSVGRTGALYPWARLFALDRRRLIQINATDLAQDKMHMWPSIWLFRSRLSSDVFGEEHACL